MPGYLARSDQSVPVDIYVAKLLVALGLKSSRTEADRQVTAGVNIDGVTSTEKLIRLEKRPARLAIRVGKQAKIAVIERLPARTPKAGIQVGS